MLAYLDSFAGLVPCKVLDISERDSYGVVYVRFQVTATRGAWKRGAVDTMTGRAVVPRDKVTRKRSLGGARILPYSWDDYRAQV